MTSPKRAGKRITSRQQFERWALRFGFDQHHLVRDPYGSYRNDEIYGCWIGWQAARRTRK